jgi:serine/threonine protein kinase
MAGDSPVKSALATPSKPYVQIDTLRTNNYFACGKETSTKPLTITDFKIHNNLVSGRFGSLILASHNKSGKVVALNSYHKAVLAETCQQHVPLREKELLESLQHPFISKVIGSLSDKSSLYLIFDMEPGASLSSLLCNAALYGITDAQKVFYAACVLSVLKYAHSKHIIHRGLHPDSLLIDRQGYLKVSDWGFAKQVMDRTFTLCGHVEYLCPEAISHDAGYSKGADFWALGVLIFEMLLGRSAFVPNDEGEWSATGKSCEQAVQQSHDAITIENIVASEPAFPPGMPQPAKSIIQGLCQKNPTQRLGCRKGSCGIEEIERHIWFQQGRGIDFNRLEKRLISPPWSPAVSGPLDCRYYDPSIIIEEIPEVPVYSGYNCLEWNAFQPIAPSTAGGQNSPAAHSSSSTCTPSDDSTDSPQDGVDMVVVPCGP